MGKEEKTKVQQVLARLVWATVVIQAVLAAYYVVLGGNLIYSILFCIFLGLSIPALCCKVQKALLLYALGALLFSGWSAFLVWEHSKKKQITDAVIKGLIGGFQFLSCVLALVVLCANRPPKPTSINNGDSRLDTMDYAKLSDDGAAGPSSRANNDNDAKATDYDTGGFSHAEANEGGYGGQGHAEDGEYDNDHGKARDFPQNESADYGEGW